jgi:hypothetical protein
MEKNIINNLAVMYTCVKGTEFFCVSMIFPFEFDFDFDFGV